MNIVDPILFQCRCQPMAMALCAPGTVFGSVTYGRLEQMIHSVARNVQSYKVTRDSIVALFIKDPILQAAFVLGLAKLGVASVSGQELELPDVLKPTIIFADGPHPIKTTAQVVVVDQKWVSTEQSPPDALTGGEMMPNEVCRIALTSGTTGEAKAVAITNKLILPRIFRLQMLCGNRFPDCSRVYMDMGISTAMGFTYLIYVLSRGGSLFLRGPDIVDTLEVFSAYRIQAIIASPSTLAQVAEICSEKSALPWGLDVAIATGSMLTPALGERVRARLCTNLVSLYGSTEIGAIATAPAAVLSKIEGAVGYVTAGVTVDAIDPSGKALPAGEEGLLRIRSDYLVDGYIGDAATTQKKFRDGGFVPGDIGRIMPNGMLIISGRDQAIINIGGDKIRPERIESALTSFPKIRDAAAYPMVTSSGVQVLCSAIVWSGGADIEGVQVHLRGRLPRTFMPRYFISVDAIPRNANGKIDRAKLKNIGVKGLSVENAAGE